jgi:hypothetical protein
VKKRVSIFLCVLLLLGTVMAYPMPKTAYAAGETFTWLSGVTVNGEAAEATGIYSFQADVTVVEGILIELQGVPETVTVAQDAQNSGPGFYQSYDSDRIWTLTSFQGGASSTLVLSLMNADEVTQKISITVNYDFQLQVSVDGTPLASDSSNASSSSYSTTVTSLGPHSIVIGAGAGVIGVLPQANDIFALEPNSYWDRWTLTFQNGQLTGTLNLTLISGSSVSHTVVITVNCDPQWVSGLTVDGQTADLSFVSGDSGNEYFCNVTVDQTADIPISFTLADGWSYSGGGDGAVAQNDANTAWLLTSFGGETSLVFTYANNESVSFMLNITLYYEAPGGGGGGGGGGGAATVNVVNQPNQPNLSSDTILIPANTQEAGGQSTTQVTSADIEALIRLAEEHREDVPDGDIEAVIQIEDENPDENSDYLVNINESDVDRLAGSSIDALTVRTGASDFRIRREALGGLDAGSEGTVQVRLQRMDREGKPGIDAILTAGEKIITVVDGVYSLEIRIPYELQPGEDPNSLCIEYLREDGTTELVTECRYDPERKAVSFFPSHLSKYGIAYRPVLYSDVAANHWANGYITFLAARDIITTPTGGRFRPDDAITRAEFINMAARAFSAARLGSRSYQSYRDVSPGQWYALAVGWSYLNNISPVLSSRGNFYPNRGLTREDMATLLNNVSLSVGLRIKTEKASVLFGDAKGISSYAWDGVSRMVTCGVVSEGGGGRFLPRDYCTRAQAAQSISLLMAKMR